MDQDSAKQRVPPDIAQQRLQDFRADCPSLEEWALYDAKLQSDAKAEALLIHAGECDACGALLADLADPKPEAGSKVTLLKSNTPEWKRSVVATLVSSQGRSVRPAARRWIWAAAAAAFIGLIAAGTSSFAVLRLLAYAAPRSFDFRVPGSRYQAVQVRLGTGQKDGLTLLASSFLIALRQRLQPQSAAWLHAGGLEQLLTLRDATVIDRAIDDLDLARLSEPHDPSILNDLSVALLVRAQFSTGSSPDRLEDISRAIETLTQAASGAHPDPVALFNLALAYEQQQSFGKALETWQRFTETEPHGGWADEARRHMERIRESQKSRLTPARPGDDDAITMLVARGFRSEGGLDANAVAEHLRANHNDPFLHSLLENRGTSERGVGWLEKAGQAFNHGDSSGGEEAAREAVASFLRSGNAAGAALGRFELAYAQQRLSQPEQCIQTAQSALRSSEESRYRWIEIQSRLTLATCLATETRYDDAFQEAERALKVANSAQYSSLQLRSLGIASSALREAGSYRAALGFDSEGLSRFWSGQGTRQNGYQSYYGLAASLFGLRYPSAAAAAMREAVELAASLPDRSLEAMARSKYGEMLVDANLIAEATDQLNKSEALFQKLPVTPGLQLYRSYARLSEARLEGRRGMTEDGLEKVAELESISGSFRNPAVESELLEVKSELFSRNGSLSLAEGQLRRLLALGDADRLSVPTAGDRSALARRVSDAVNLLADGYFRQGNVAEAFRIWTRYNSCFQTLKTVDADTVQLVYADLPSGPVVWVATVSGLDAVRLSLGGDFALRAAAFRRAVSDSAQPVSRIQSLGREIFAQLIAPLGRRLDRTNLYIAADAPFSSVPFEALVSRDGSWLGSRHRIVYSPPMGGAPEKFDANVSGEQTLVAAGYGSASVVLGYALPALPDFAEGIEAATSAFPRHLILTGDTATVPAVEEMMEGADVFYFSGHSLVTSQDAALVLSAGESDARGRLLWASRLPTAATRIMHLAVLAACSTGRPRDENRNPSSDMARAFLLAGVPQVVASGWDVDSTATNELVKEFFRLLGKGIPAQDAFSSSVERLRQEPHYMHPYYWAAFAFFQR